MMFLFAQSRDHLCKRGRTRSRLTRRTNLLITHYSLRSFTILEMVIAIGLLAVGVVAALSLYTSAVRQFKEAVDSSQVALLSEFILSEAQTYLNDNESADIDRIDWTKHDDFPGFEYMVEFTATEVPGEYKVEVVVGWGREKPPPHTETRFDIEERFYTVLLK